MDIERIERQQEPLVQRGNIVEGILEKLRGFATLAVVLTIIILEVYACYSITNVFGDIRDVGCGNPISITEDIELSVCNNVISITQKVNNTDSVVKIDRTQWLNLVKKFIK